MLLLPALALTLYGSIRSASIYCLTSLFVNFRMGRGVAWAAEKNNNVARALITALEIVTLGTDQTSQRFLKPIFERVRPLASLNYISAQYKCKDERKSQSKMEQISTDYQKFRFSPRFIRGFSPTNVA